MMAVLAARQFKNGMPIPSEWLGIFFLSNLESLFVPLEKKESFMFLFKFPSPFTLPSLNSYPSLKSLLSSPYNLPPTIPLLPLFLAPKVTPPFRWVLISTQRSPLTYQRRILCVEFSNQVKKLWVFKTMIPLKFTFVNVSCLSLFWK